MKFFTIGVFNSTEREFFEKLLNNKVDTFCDTRQRRAVRGARYAFVNSIRLQKKLNELGIKYRHIKDLAPTAVIRGIQKQTDLEKGEQKTDRQKLGPEFTREYRNSILNHFDFPRFINGLNEIGANEIVLFCVEENPDACHRSIVAQKLAEEYDYEICHL